MLSVNIALQVLLLYKILLTYVCLSFKVHFLANLLSVCCLGGYHCIGCFDFINNCCLAGSFLPFSSSNVDSPLSLGFHIPCGNVC